MNLSETSGPVRRVLEHSLEGYDPTVDEGTVLLSATGADLAALMQVADHLRRVQVGDVVTYVVNRNINFTNVCIKTCRFCAYARGLRSEEGYLLPPEEVAHRAAEAVAFGVTEICIQAGLAPSVDPETYLRYTRVVKEAAPGLHLHAWSPEEVRYGAARAGTSIAAWIAELMAAGVNSLPGTSAEILDDSVRRRIAPGRITSAEWEEVVRSAHALGLPTTSTIMYGHVETPRHRAAHLARIRAIQRDTGGFTEFVPLSFVAAEAPLSRLTAGRLPGPSEDTVLALYATARLMLGRHLPNLQVSWVKEGPARAVKLLGCGGNDLGGTLLNESISTAAGSGYGQRLAPAELTALATAAGRPAAERTTLYQRRPTSAAPHPLDALPPEDARFGSYAALLQDTRFRYEPAPRSSRARSSGRSRSSAVPGDPTVTTRP